MAHRGRHIAPSIRRISRTWVLPLTLVVSLVMGGVAFAADLKADLIVGPGFQDSVNVGAKDAGPYTNLARLAVNGGGTQNYPFTVTASGASGAITGATGVEITSATGTDSTISYTVPCLAGGGAFSGQVTFTAAESSGLSNKVVSVTISGTANACAPTNTPPTLSMPGNMTVEGNTLGGGNVTYTAAANDTQDGALTPTCSPASGSFFALGGPHTVNCSVTDTDGLSANGSFTITVVDTIGPVVTGPADATIEGNTAGGATQASGLAALGSASATDTVWGNVSASITNDAPTTFSLGPTTVAYSAVDGSGNNGSTSVILTVTDTTAPSISGTPANISTTTMNAGGKVIIWTDPAASDIVDTDVPVNCSPASGSTFPIGTTSVTCSATDDSGNNAQSSFTVQVSLLTVAWKEPVNGPSVINVAKAGRVIPLKVEVFVDGAENVDTGSVTFKLWKSNSCVSAVQDAIETFVAVGEAAGGNAYVWNADGGFYQYNLKTPTTPGCYRGEAYLDGELAGYFLINATK